MNMYGGKITNGKTIALTKDGKTTNGHGGNVALLKATAQLNLYGGEISNGSTVQWGGNVYLYPGTLNMSGGIIKGGSVNGNKGNMSANITMRPGAVINMSGGEIYGCITGTENQNSTLNMSGSAKLTTNGTNVKGNIVSISVMINISKLNPDARIGFQCSGVGGVESTDALGGEEQTEA
jgi:hypothetical protein